MNKLSKVRSLVDLRQRAIVNKAYENLAINAAKNLGGHNIRDLHGAMDWLTVNAQETDEEGVVAEINFCR